MGARADRRAAQCAVRSHGRRGEVAEGHSHPLGFIPFGAQGRSRIASDARASVVRCIARMQVDVDLAGFRMEYGKWDPIGDSMRIAIDTCCPSGPGYTDGRSPVVPGRRWSACALNPPRIPAPDAGSELLRRRIVDYIAAHLGDDLRIASLADLVGLSSAHFIRVFRRTFGKTPHRYVVERRLEAARELLAGRKSLASIADGLGFASQAHFTAAYRRHFGDTPGRTRRAQR